MEVYKNSKSALITYIVTAREYRKHKLARLLLQCARDVLPPLRVYLEAHRPETYDRVMPSSIRLAVYSNLGLFPVSYNNGDHTQCN